MPIFFICMLIFVAWLYYERSKHSRIEANRTKEFWDREEKANHTRNKDISNLPYLHPDCTALDKYRSTFTEEQSDSYEKLMLLLKKPMLDLSAYSNTDLKLAYGVGHFKTLTNYDDNYNNFLTQLSNLGRALLSQGNYEASICCYQTAIQNGSKKIADFTSLANAYLESDQPDEVVLLISQISENDALERKENLLMKLRETLATYQ